uniref:Uncharacterized protein n=1 Tax=Peronospora matthiolae TaxID=2874970 RepID=A0AAV1T3T2_9STRA
MITWICVVRAEDTAELAEQGEEERAFNWSLSRARAQELVLWFRNRPFHYIRMPTSMTDLNAAKLKALEDLVRKGVISSRSDNSILADLIGTKLHKDLVHLVKFLPWFRSRPDMNSRADDLQKTLCGRSDDLRKLSRPKKGDSMYLEGAVKDLLEATPYGHNVRYGALSEELLEDTDLKKLSSRCRKRCLRTVSLMERHFKCLGTFVHHGGRNALSMSHDMPHFHAIKACFTLQHAAAKGGETLRKETEEACAKTNRGALVETVNSLMEKKARHLSPEKVVWVGGAMCSR